jgi:Sec-independent protein translocase protein TatA
MNDFEKLGAFYLGRIYDSSGRQTTAEPLLYDSKDLVTHAVCVGMTGSGKTGLCIDLLEEAAIDGVPAIAIDPKGDIANLLLQFPNLSAAEFAPWVNEEEAARQNLSRDEFAAQQAETWRKGLEQWGQAPQRIAKLRDSAEFAVYTPGSAAGRSLSVLKSFAPPSGAAADDREALRDRISGTASAVLSLLGIDAEPMKSREHILLSNIFDAAWAGGSELTVEELIHQIQSPPMMKVGVVDLEAFYPAKERFELAMALNSLLASPGFEAWLEGEPLDIARLLYSPAGKPRISIISIAHLSDSERMFFVTLLLNEVLTWTRTQSGTTSLRAIVYMDEIFGYFPPTANPPSKRPLLTLLKQARAFGVGVVLATQNPVDLDYKGLANTGTWFIGRLQTERDKQRLIEGLEGASLSSGGAFDRGRIEQVLAGLGKRVFLMNNVHDEAPVVFESRWALSYLRGPLTRGQIKTLMASRAPAAPEPETVRTAASRAGVSFSQSTQRPVLPPDVPVAYVPTRGSQAGVTYQPVLLGVAQVRYIDAKAKIDFLEEKAFVTPVRDDSLPVQWEECAEANIDPSDLEKEPADGATFGTLPAVASKAKSYAGWQKDFVTWLYGHRQLNVYRSEVLKTCSEPAESEGDFRIRLQQATREERDRAIEKLRLKYQSRIVTLQDRLRRAQQAVEREKQQSQSQTLDTVVSVGTSVLGALFGRKKLGTAATGAVRSAGRVRKEAGDVSRAEETVEAMTQQLADIEAQVEAEVQTLQSQYDTSAVTLQGMAIKPKKTNINVRLFTLAWAPYTSEGGTAKPAWE